jgi:hypothetical protein
MKLSLDILLKSENPTYTCRLADLGVLALACAGEAFDWMLRSP